MFLIAVGAQKKAVFLFIAGIELRRIYSTLDPKDAEDYDEVIKKFKTHFTPLKKPRRDVRFLSNILKGRRICCPTNLLSDFAANRCEFTATDAEIIKGCFSTKLRQHTLYSWDARYWTRQNRGRGKGNRSIRDHNQSLLVKKIMLSLNWSLQLAKEVQRNIRKGKKTASTLNRNQAASQRNKRIDSTKKCFACGYAYSHKDECPAQ